MSLWRRLLWRILGVKVLALPPGALVVFELRRPVTGEVAARMREGLVAMVKQAEPTADVLLLDGVGLSGVIEPWRG